MELAQLTAKRIAKVAHEVNKAYCEFLGDDSQVPWDMAPEWQRESAVNGVKFHAENPDAGPEASHECWMKEKADTGWTYGWKKDPHLKQHPCMVAFTDLPKEQQLKDILFRQVVHSLLHS